MILDQIEAVIFDLDGTLMDSMWLWTEIDIEYLGRYGFSLPPDLQTAIQGMSFTETAVYFKERFQLPDSVEEIKQEWNRMAYDKYANEVPLKKGAFAFLQELRQQGLKTAIASSNSRELIMACLTNNRAEELFDCITTSCDVGKGKPAPDIYLHVAETLGVDPKHCLVFEDITAGIQAGLRAGMRVCAVEDAHAADQRGEIRQLAHYYIRDYDEIRKGTYEVTQ
jgi:HAD superfamily hydrolase (TIGR01509 family)